MLRHIENVRVDTQGNPVGDPRLLLFDAYHDEYRGVVCVVQLVDGSVARGDRVTSMATGDSHELLEVCVRRNSRCDWSRACTMMRSVLQQCAATTFVWPSNRYEQHGRSSSHRWVQRLVFLFGGRPQRL